MEVVCENCGAKLRIPGEKIPLGQQVDVSCPKCKDEVILDNVRAKPEISPPAGREGVVRVGPDAGYAYEEVPPLDFLEEGERLALVMGNDASQIEKLRQVVEGLGYVCVPAENSEKAISKMGFYHFDLVILSDEFEGIEPGQGRMLHHLNSLPMSVRRWVFLVLIGDRFRTIDRMMAFAMSANLVVNGKDLDKLPGILRQAISDNQDFYRVFMDTLRDK